MGRIERAPDWILKYRNKIEEGTFTVEDVLEWENRIRPVPIKLSTVTRAINAMGHPTAGLHSEEIPETAAVLEHHETNGARDKVERGPGWLQKYRDGMENGTIKAEDILESENRIRPDPIKLSTVTRAINAMGYPTAGLHSEEIPETAAVSVHHETDGAQGRVESGPGWLLKYRDGIENGTIKAEDIWESENRIRPDPIKRSTVTRAINAMGYPLTGLRSEEMPETVAIGKESSGKKEIVQVTEMSPYWIRKYSEKISEGAIKAEDILESENRIRAAPIKLATVARAINTFSLPITSLSERKEQRIVRGKGLYSSYIGDISDATEESFNSIKSRWEKDLDKTLQNDYFLNILLALANLLGHGKTLAPVK